MDNLSVGQRIQFGNYDWRVLEIKDQAALIITEDIIGQQPYNNFAGGVTWAECSLRKYLNKEFYNTFTTDQQGRIKQTKIKNKDNQWYGSDGGEETCDYIFLLDIEEVVCKYFGDSSRNLENRSPKQRYWFQKKDQNNDKRRANLNGSGWWWWLRTPGRDNKRAVYIHGDGNIGIQGNGTYRYSSQDVHRSTGDNSGGIRPVLWLKLEK